MDNDNITENKELVEMPITGDTELTTASKDTESDASESLKWNKLTPKARKFVSLVLDGKPTIDAYKTSGYKGNDHSAYQLRSSLRWAIDYALRSEGVDINGALIRLKQLLSLPLDSNITSLTVDQLLQVVKTVKALKPEDMGNTGNKQITPIIIQRVENLMVKEEKK